MMVHPLRARRAVIVAPHPDDETIGTWALMRKLRSSQAAVTVIVVSDGGASHPESQRWPRDRLVRERRRETLRAMRLLGVFPTAIRFLSLPDGALEADPAALSRSLARAVRARRRPDLIVGPATNDDHPDHRAVAHALRSVKRFAARQLGYRVWSCRGLPSKLYFEVRLDARTLQSKRRAVRTYRTQLGVITDAEAGFTLTRRHLNMFVRPTERYEVLW